MCRNIKLFWASGWEYWVVFRWSHIDIFVAFSTREQKKIIVIVPSGFYFYDLIVPRWRLGLFLFLPISNRLILSKEREKERRSWTIAGDKRETKTKKNKKQKNRATNSSDRNRAACSNNNEKSAVASHCAGGTENGRRRLLLQSGLLI